MNEIFKDIPGYEGKYQVSNLGQVLSLNYHGHKGKNQIMCGGIGEKGYHLITLCKNGKQKTHKIHRLVAELFLDNPNNLPEVNHKDENTANNRVDNLEWCLGKDNVRYSQAKPVGCFKDDILIKKYDALNDVKLDNYSSSAVSRCCNGKKRLYYGYSWKFIDK